MKWGLRAEARGRLCGWLARVASEWAAGPPVVTGVPGREPAAKISALDRMARAGVLVGQERGPLRSGPASTVFVWLVWGMVTVAGTCLLPPHPREAQRSFIAAFRASPRGPPGVLGIGLSPASRVLGPDLGASLPGEPCAFLAGTPPSCSHCFFFQEFTACLRFRKHLHRARLGSEGSDFHPPPRQARCPLPAWHSVG